MHTEAGPAREGELLARLSRWRRLALAAAALLALCAAALLVLVLRQPRVTTDPSATLPPPPNASTQPAAENVVEAAGTLVPSHVQTIYCSEGGAIRAWHCKSGEEVRKGQKIVTVVADEREVEIARVKSVIGEHKAVIEVLTGALLKSTGADEQRVKLELAHARVKAKSGEEELDRLRLRYNGGEITSPLDGVVIVANPEQVIGKKVSTFEPICQVAQLQGAWHVDVWFAERDVGPLLQFLRETKDAQATVELVAAAFPGKTFKGTLRRDDIARETTRRGEESGLPARVQLDEETLTALRILSIGANVRVKVLLPRKP